MRFPTRGSLARFRVVLLTVFDGMKSRETVRRTGDSHAVFQEWVCRNVFLWNALRSPFLAGSTAGSGTSVADRIKIGISIGGLISYNFVFSSVGPEQHFRTR